MSHKSVKARVCWLKAEEGGRPSPPPGPKYSTVAKFEDEKDTWLTEAWSLILEFSGAPDESLCITTDVSFLSEEGPMRLLHSGSQFELYEGRRLVARGEVL
ncbi:MAG: hypothetical protein QOF62_1065 [Pyrinomonadaceae bacterium]|jgi:hypothetical protein|nr:hypothetical protein [Pyrinomonadaceae bacterium]